MGEDKTGFDVGDDIETRGDIEPAPKIFRIGDRTYTEDDKVFGRDNLGRPEDGWRILRIIGNDAVVIGWPGGDIEKDLPIATFEKLQAEGSGPLKTDDRVTRLIGGKEYVLGREGTRVNYEDKLGYYVTGVSDEGVLIENRRGDILNLTHQEFRQYNP